MAIRVIRQEGDEVLRKKCKVVEEIDMRIEVLVQDMLDTMYEADGVGLAAPQIGILKRIAVIDVGEGPMVLINPVIVETKGAFIEEEGCLSIPGIAGGVERPEYVKVRAKNLNGKTYHIEGTELLAKALCHEIDHLDGVLFTDKIVAMPTEGNQSDEV